MIEDTGNRPVLYTYRAHKVQISEIFRFDVDKGGSIDSEELGSLVRVLG